MRSWPIVTMVVVILLLLFGDFLGFETHFDRCYHSKKRCIVSLNNSLRKVINVCNLLDSKRRLVFPFQSIGSVEQTQPSSTFAIVYLHNYKCITQRTWSCAQSEESRFFCFFFPDSGHLVLCRVHLGCCLHNHFTVDFLCVQERRSMGQKLYTH